MILLGDIWVCIDYQFVSLTVEGNMCVNLIPVLIVDWNCFVCNEGFIQQLVSELFLRRNHTTSGEPIQVKRVNHFWFVRFFVAVGRIDALGAEGSCIEGSSKQIYCVEFDACSDPSFVQIFILIIVRYHCVDYKVVIKQIDLKDFYNGYLN